MSELHYQRIAIWADFVKTVNQNSQLMGVCSICGANIYHKSSDYCERCIFWIEQRQLYESVQAGRTAIRECLCIDGTFYHIPLYRSDDYWWRGYLGKIYSIRILKTGRVLQTDNLWKVEFRYGGYQGDTIPPFLVEDNAEFMGERPPF